MSSGDYPVERVHGCCHRFPADFPFDGTELVLFQPDAVASVNKTSLRAEFEAIKARFKSLCADGKLPPEGRALFESMLLLFELLPALRNLLSSYTRNQHNSPARWMRISWSAIPSASACPWVTAAPTPRISHPGKNFVRSMPGRLIGVSIDNRGDIVFHWIPACAGMTDGERQ